MHFGFIRNGIVVAIIAHGLIGATLVWDKVLLRQPETRNLFSYVFWVDSSVFLVWLWLRSDSKCRRLLLWRSLSERASCTWRRCFSITPR